MAKKAKNTKAAITRAIRGAAGRKEPVIENPLDMPAAEFYRAVRDACDWFRLEKGKQDYARYVLTWMRFAGYGKPAMAAVRACPDWMFTPVMGAYARLFAKGLPDLAEHPQMAEFFAAEKDGEEISKRDWLRARIAEFAERGEALLAEKREAAPSPAKRPDLQAQIAKNAANMAEPIEQYLDECLAAGRPPDPAEFDAHAALTAAGAKKAHAEHIRSKYAAIGAEYRQDYAIFTAADDGSPEWQDVQAAYVHCGADELRQCAAFYRSVAAACDLIIGHKSPKTMEKQFKHARRDAAAGLKGLSPLDIIGKREAWVYNAKTRKLGCYAADSDAGLRLDGNQVAGFDAAASRQKTVRKPKEQLKGIGRRDAAALRRLFDGLTGVAVRLPGKGGPELLIVRVF